MNDFLSEIKTYMTIFSKGKIYNIENNTISQNEIYFLIKGEDIAIEVEEVENNEIKNKISHPIYEIAIVYDFKSGISLSPSFIQLKIVDCLI